MNYTAVVIVAFFIAFDVLTGWIKAIATKTTDSSIMRTGLFHKLGELLAIAFGYACEFAFPYIGMTISLPLASAICTYIVLMETASIVENLSRISPKLANALDKYFDQSKVKKDGEEDVQKDESTDSE